jgi:drug/metabolite transporter (DMT)-like permease
LKIFNRFFILMTDDFRMIFNFGGESAALSAAFLWALASVLFGRIGQFLSPLKMNLLKNVIAIAMTIAVLSADAGLFLGLDFYAATLLLLSGAIGIGLGDSAYFGALKHVGPRRALLVMVLSPPITGILAQLFLAETLSYGAWLGVLITIAGVSWVITERVPDSGQAVGHKNLGVALALLAAAGQATGAVLSHAAFIHLNMSPMRSALIRLIGGTLTVLLVMPVLKGSEGQGYQNLNSFRRWAMIVLTVFIGTFLGIWLQQVSLKYSAAGVAQTLFATSPLFVIPIVALMGERVSLRALMGALIATVGVGFLFGLQ